MSVSRSAVAAYMTRNNASPSPDKLRLVSAEYNIPIGWFYDGLDQAPTSELQVARKEEFTPIDRLMHDGRSIVLPVWTAAAGFDPEEDWDFDESEETEAVPLYLCGPDPENVRIIRVRGSSMSPRIPFGSRVLAHLQHDLGDRDLGVFQTPGGRLQVKLFRITPFGPQLVSLNDGFSPIGVPEISDWLIRAAIITIKRPYAEGESNIEYNDGIPLKG